MPGVSFSNRVRTRRASVGLVAAAAALTAALLSAVSPAAGGFLMLSTRPNAIPAASSSTTFSAEAQALDDGGITFFPNVKMPCSTDVAGPIACSALLEPEVASGPDGTIYVTAQEGVPGGVNLWRRDPGSSEYVHVAKPDRNDPLTEQTGLALGGGDNDLAVTTDGRVLVATLSLVSAPVSYSTDRGKTFTKVEFANGLLNVDRMWLTTVGDKTVYYTYHDNQASQIWLVKSTDGGESYSTPVPVIPPEMLPQSIGIPFVTVGNVQGDIVADPDGRVYMPFLAPKDIAKNATPMQRPDSYYVAVTDTNGENPVIKTVFEGDKDIMALFPAIASDLAGNLYATWSDRHGVFLSISRDHADTWSTPVKISTGKGNATTVFPFVVAGSKGRVALAWLGTSATDNNDTNAEWRTYFSMTTDALKKDPTWTQVIASDHVVHHEAICLDGLNCDVTGGNRSLAEVLQMGLTKDGRVIISYPGTSSADISGWSYVAEQRFGPGLYANVKPNPPALVKKTTPGGLIDALLRKVGNAPWYFTSSRSGTGLSDAEGNTVDSPGDVGTLSSKQGSAGHVASANLWTTTFGGVPLAFDSEAFKANTIVGGNFNLTTYLQEASGEVANNNVTIKLYDVAPGENGVRKEIASGSAGYIAGVDPTKGNYAFKIAKPWEILKGHHLTAEMSFACACSTTMRFYYGNETYPSSFTVDRFDRVAVQGTKVTRPSVSKGGQLPATGLGDETILGLLLLAGAALTLRRLARTA
jgi:hypothetical protein